MRYDDAELGPRRIPNCEKPNDGTSALSPTAKFEINLELKKVILHENGRPVELGSQIIYNIV